MSLDPRVLARVVDLAVEFTRESRRDQLLDPAAVIRALKEGGGDPESDVQRCEVKRALLNRRRTPSQNKKLAFLKAKASNRRSRQERARRPAPTEEQRARWTRETARRLGEQDE